MIMAYQKITEKGLKSKSNKSLYTHLLKHKWDKESIYDLLVFAGVQVEKGLNLKQLVEKYHDDICECVFETYQNAF